MKIGIFGGAFNPPHIGHVGAANTAAVKYNLDLLIIIPTGVPPHKALPVDTPELEKRLQMTQNAFNDTSRFKVHEDELRSTNISYTIDSVSMLKREYPGAELFLLVGDDQFNALDTWKDSDLLLTAVTPVLLSRDTVPISSSDIRKMLPIRKGKEFLVESNYAYIIKHRLYGAKPDWNWLRECAYSMLDPLRIPHVRACETEALRLATRWGVDLDEAKEAAILHDITKRLDFSQNMCIIAKHGFNVGNINPGEEKLLHSVTGALLAQSEYGASVNVTEAIKWHTTGKANMSKLEKIIYIADYIEATRSLPDIDKLRKAAYENIDDAMVLGLEMTIADLTARGISSNAATNEALCDLKRRY